MCGFLCRILCRLRAFRTARDKRRPQAFSRRCGPDTTASTPRHFCNAVAVRANRPLLAGRCLRRFGPVLLGPAGGERRRRAEPHPPLTLLSRSRGHPHSGRRPAPRRSQKASGRRTCRVSPSASQSLQAQLSAEHAEACRSRRSPWQDTTRLRLQHGPRRAAGSDTAGSEKGCETDKGPPGAKLAGATRRWFCAPYTPSAPPPHHREAGQRGVGEPACIAEVANSGDAAVLPARIGRGPGPHAIARHSGGGGRLCAPWRRLCVAPYCGLG